MRETELAVIHWPQLTLTRSVGAVPMFRKHFEGHKAAEHGDGSDGAAGQLGAERVLTQIRIETLGVISRKRGFGFAERKVSINAAAGRVAYAEFSKGVYVYDVADLDGSERPLLVDSTGLSDGMNFSPSGRYLALPRSTAATVVTPAYNVNGVICDLETGKSHILLSGRNAGLAGSHGAYGIVIDATDSLVAVADLADGLHVRRLKDWGDPSVPVLQVLQKWGSGALAWSADGKTLYHQGGKQERQGYVQKVGVLRCTSPSELSFEVTGSMVIPAKKPLRGFGLRGLAVADEAGLLAVGGDKGADAIHVFDLATSTEVCHGVTPNAATPFLRFSGPGDHLLSVSTDNILRLWSVASGPEGRTMQLEGTQQFFGKIVAVDARPGSEFDILMVAVVKGAAEVYRVSLPIAN